MANLVDGINAGVYPWARDTSLAYNQYASGQTGSGILTVTLLKLESKLKPVGLLRAWTQKRTKPFLLSQLRLPHAAIG